MLVVGGACCCCCCSVSLEAELHVGRAPHDVYKEVLLEVREGQAGRQAGGQAGKLGLQGWMALPGQGEGSFI
jgi:transcription elongation factor Elf1